MQGYKNNKIDFAIRAYLIGKGNICTSHTGVRKEGKYDFEEGLSKKLYINAMYHINDIAFKSLSNCEISG